MSSASTHVCIETYEYIMRLGSTSLVAHVCIKNYEYIMRSGSTQSDSTSDYSLTEARK